jgi:nicotinate-nucleotide pyrophosphorylase (carboxylating)
MIMLSNYHPELLANIKKTVKIALKEDLNYKRDITSLLIPRNKRITAKVITREDMIVCGQAWVNEVFNQIDPEIKIGWYYKDGDFVKAKSVLYSLEGEARGVLTGERTSLNFLQMLSGTATITHKYVQKIKTTKSKLLDTRKTIPGMRLAQKYAVRCGGGCNHRMGLYDAFLIKENHIMACGSITLAINAANRAAKNKLIEIEVENLQQLQEAITARADIVMLDNFSLPEMRQAVKINRKRVKLEVSGNISLETIKSIAKTGVDYISVGALTKNVKAIDLSMRILNVKYTI